MGAQNAIIEVDDGRVFCGWDMYGDIVLKSPENKKYAYRMSRTLAMRTVSKVEAVTKSACHITNAL